MFPDIPAYVPESHGRMLLRVAKLMNASYIIATISDMTFYALEAFS